MSLTILPNLGDKVRDKITGFSGIVTGYCSYITGCDQLLVNPPVKEDGGYVSGQWIDVDRCEVVEARAVAPESVSSAERPGPCEAAPVK